jgi:hypothetical protein
VNDRGVVKKVLTTMRTSIASVALLGAGAFVLVGVQPVFGLDGLHVGLVTFGSALLIAGAIPVFRILGVDLPEVVRTAKGS